MRRIELNWVRCVRGMPSIRRPPLGRIRARFIKFPLVFEGLPLLGLSFRLHWQDR
jgi:hypothetical protein